MCSLLEEIMTGLSNGLAIVLEEHSSKVLGRLLAIFEQTLGSNIDTIG